jgi:hypothetical protein
LAWRHETRQKVQHTLVKAHTHRQQTEQARHTAALKLARQRTTAHQKLHKTLFAQLTREMKNLRTACHHLRTERTAQRDQRRATLNRLLERQATPVKTAPVRFEKAPTVAMQDTVPARETSKAPKTRTAKAEQN